MRHVIIAVLCALALAVGIAAGTAIGATAPTKTGTTADTTSATTATTTDTTTATTSTTDVTDTTEVQTKEPPPNRRVLDSRALDSRQTTSEYFPTPPAVSAPAWAVYDGSDGSLLAGKGVETARPMASLTKVMTALVVVERTTGSEKVPISQHAAESGEGSEIGMKAGQKYTVDTLINAMLAYSANDAAVALAEYVSGTEADFIEKMNERAVELELGSTSYTNVSGLPIANPNESSPADIVKLTQTALKDPRIRTAVKLREVVIKRPGDSTVTLPNRNLLLGKYRGVDGVKTGHTNAAGYCLVTHHVDPDGNELYTVVLGELSEDARVADSKKLLDWGQQLHQSLTFAEAADEVASVPVRYTTEPVDLFIEDDVVANVRLGAKIEERIVAPSLVDPPLRAGDYAGTYELWIDDRKAAESKLYVARRLNKPTRRRQVREYAKLWKQAWRRGVRETRRGARNLGNDFTEYWGLA